MDVKFFLHGLGTLKFILKKGLLFLPFCLTICSVCKMALFAKISKFLHTYVIGQAFSSDDSIISMDRLSNYPSFYVCKRRTIKKPKKLRNSRISKSRQNGQFQIFSKGRLRQSSKIGEFGKNCHILYLLVN